MYNLTYDDNNFYINDAQLAFNSLVMTRVDDRYVVINYAARSLAYGKGLFKYQDFTLDGTPATSTDDVMQWATDHFYAVGGGEGGSTPGPAGHTPLTYSGPGVPSAGTGVTGDLYFDTSVGGQGDFYSKVAGIWGFRVNLRGPQGPTGYGVPAGGTTGQVLTKIADGDYLFEWRTPAGGGSGGISGLTAGRLPRATSESTIGNSSISDNGSLVATTLPVKAPKFFVNSTDYWIDTHPGDGYMRLYAQGANPILISVNGGPTLYNSATGQVGINTLTPGAQLEVKGNDLSFPDSFSNSLKLSGAYPAIWMTTPSQGVYIGMAGGSLYIGSTSGNASSGVRMVMNPSGNFGFGVSAAMEKIDVDGNARIRGYAELNEVGAAPSAPSTGCRLYFKSGHLRVIDSNGNDVALT